MNAPVQIPEGFRQDSKGRLVPEDTIKPIDLVRDESVIDLIGQAKQAQEHLKKFKAIAFAEITAFIDLSLKQFDVHIGGNKGNITLYSFDGKYKIIRQIQDTIRFDERLQAAKILIDECIQSWSVDSNNYLKALILEAFQVDKEGKISTGRVLGLRRHDFDDPKWLKAMDAIAESINIVDSKRYVRFYERDSEGKYQAISLDFANV
ncbi:MULTISPECIES: DUF3164 family protein [Acinetobacter]|jgi:hypothetical protein|uniref:DUF3164 family protein n=1 Tax=Acinetobacter nematophilus TaxID=2994642 RepID=A0A9X3IFD8_9GAMM|nr:MULTISPECIES: DUF3164 family protein [Acinetobacter]MCX5466522.1 DUF3164 family protein [Acinetobacter nematophilus]